MQGGWTLFSPSARIAKRIGLLSSSHHPRLVPAHLPAPALIPLLSLSLLSFSHLSNTLTEGVLTFATFQSAVKVKRCIWEGRPFVFIEERDCESVTAVFCREETRSPEMIG